jgi:hypothetical protein
MLRAARQALEYVLAHPLPGKGQQKSVPAAGGEGHHRVSFKPFLIAG